VRPDKNAGNDKPDYRAKTQTVEQSDANCRGREENQQSEK
jgi:hypothetical protein